MKQQIAEDQKSALKERRTDELSTLRMLWAAISNKEIDLRKKDIGLSDSEVLDVLNSEVKKRKDAIAEYKKAQRDDLAKKEEHELTILKKYLPPEIGDEDLTRIVRDGIREVGAVSLTDFPKVMKSIMPTLKGKASGDRIAEIVKKELSVL
ncbi:MAG: GatB/YqeY domain-containing protein [Patescibacteria group bacterium]